MNRWQRYWFGDAGGAWSLAVVRICVALSVALTLHRIAIYSGDGLGEPSPLYRPIGPWLLYGSSPPPHAVITALWIAAWAGTLGMLVGALTRISTAISCVATIALASLVFATSSTWSHQYNVTLLAQLALLGAPSGDALAIDAWVARDHRRQARAYQWGIRLAQLAVALMFASAAIHKIVRGHGTLRWALSDNLRNHLLVRYDLAGVPRTSVAEWMIDDPWRYRTAAMLNLISQLAPIVACIAIRRPVIRALCGALFVIEIIALGMVVDLWDLQWLPLVAVFIDWEALARWLARRRAPTSTATTTTSAPRAPPLPSRAIRWFVIAFVAYDTVLSFAPLDQRLGTYPFSRFPMFSTIRVRAPYGDHQAYAVAGDHFVVASDVPLDAGAQRWFDYSQRGTYLLRGAQLRAKMLAIVHGAQQRYPQLGIHGATLWLTSFVAPAYPEPARLDPYPLAIVARVVGDDYRSELGATAAASRYFRNDEPEPLALPIDAALADLDGDSVYVVGDIAGEPWLVEAR